VRSTHFDWKFLCPINKSVSSLIPIRWFDEPHRFGEIIFGQQLNLNRCFFIHGMRVDPGLAFSQAYVESTSALTVCVTGGGADVDNDWEQYKLEARKMLENGDESPPSSARCVSPHLIFMDMVHHHSLHQCRRRAL
jgi:hypothetical protein